MLMMPKVGLQYSVHMGMKYSSTKYTKPQNPKHGLQMPSGDTRLHMWLSQVKKEKAAIMTVWVGETEFRIFSDAMLSIFSVLTGPKSLFF